MICPNCKEGIVVLRWGSLCCPSCLFLSLKGPQPGRYLRLPEATRMAYVRFVARRGKAAESRRWKLMELHYNISRKVDIEIAAKIATKQRDKILKFFRESGGKK